MPEITPPPYLSLRRPQPTGGVLVTFEGGSEDEQLRILDRGAAEATGGSAPRAEAVEVSAIGGIDTARIRAPLLLRGLGIGLIHAPSKANVASVARILAAEDHVAEARPEFYLYSIPSNGAGNAIDTAERTWGIAATGAVSAPFTGKGIRIAVLDTGFDLLHPDFASRPVIAESFVAGETVDDIQGHGTHCTGIAAGPEAGHNTPRYGVAPEADILIGKVLGNNGSGLEIDILDGMAWAIEQGAEVISMSLGRATQPGEIPSAAYERLGRRALERGALIVAAAGNESARQFGFVAPVGAPANSPSILAVAAVDASGKVADFSCGGINPDGGEVDIAAPGVDIFSSFPRPKLYETLRGTSMACPFVAGAAALWAESDPALRGQALWDKLTASAAPLSHPPEDVGAGLVQAPGAALIA